MKIKDLAKIFAIMMIIMVVIPILYIAFSSTYQYFTRNNVDNSSTSIPEAPTTGSLTTS